MTMSPTVIFESITGIYDMLRLTEWSPLVADGGEVLSPDVDVLMGELMQQPPRETIAVTGAVEDDDQQWVTLGLPSKREEFTTTLVVVSNIPNRTAAEAWDRLRVLTAAVDAVFRDLTTGRPIVPTDLATIGVLSITVTGVVTALYPLADSGHVASAGVTLTVKADI